MAINIKLSETAKESLDWLKTNYQFNNFSDCINTIGTFFKANYVSPRETISNNYSESLTGVKLEITSLKKFISDDSQSLRKMHQAVERDYLMAINRKVDMIYTFALDKKTENRNEDLEKKLIVDDVNNDSKDETIRRNIEIIESKNETIRQLESIIKNQDIDLKEYFNSLNTLNKNMGFEKGITGTKIIINLSVDKVNALFKMIP